MKNFKYAVYVFVLFINVNVSSGELLNGEPEYKKCINLAENSPKKGLERANSWKQLGGGVAADHCAAIAILRMGFPRDAAIRLEKVAFKLNDLIDLKSLVLSKAAHAWLLVGNHKKAIDIFTRVLAAKPNTAAVFIDRAYARGLARDYVGTILDLNFAIALEPSNPLAFVLRASARRHLNKISAAENDIKIALSINPNFVEGLLERGILNRLRGDHNSARRDWVRVIELEPTSEAADLAKKNLKGTNLIAK